MKENQESSDKIKSLFDNISPYFDDWLETLQEKVYSYVTWEHLKKHLPGNTNSLILDAGGGTGRWAIPLAKIGYKVILCDISEGMLKQAAKNVKKEELSDRISLKEENLTNLSFSDETFDFIICEDGPISISDSDKVVRELGRVLKNSAKIWACVLGRYPLALSKVEMNSEEALKLCKSELNYIPYKGFERSRVFSPVELQKLFQQNGFYTIKLEVKGERNE